MGGHILVVDDDRDTAELLREGLVKRGFSAEAAISAEDALVRLREQEFDVVVTDVQLGALSGIELCQRVAESRPDVPVIVVTGFGSMETAIAAIRAGAYDFITKPIAMDALVIALGRAVGHRQLKSEVRRLREAVAKGHGGAIVGESPAVRRLLDLIEQVADSDATVLITGESGTGKELVAREIHSRSPRAEHPFTAVNCAALPATLLESELFGHLRGAFTDAKRARDGLFVQAAGGTVFLDEIGEMPLEMQAKLLRVLQERTVRPIGSDTEEVPFNARLLTATNRDLEGEVDAKRFRNDLYYRINVVQLGVPPLRSRGNDILLLAHHFLQRYATETGKEVTGISGAAAQRLLDYDWPGNVRELENCVQRAVTLTRLSEISVDDLPEKIRDYQSSRIVIASDNPDELFSLEEMERRYIRKVLAAVGGNKTQAARILGLDRRTLYRRIESLGIDARVAHG
jgi:DNA-binding NtrC family response regulator